MKLCEFIIEGLESEIIDALFNTMHPSDIDMFPRPAHLTSPEDLDDESQMKLFQMVENIYSFAKQNNIRDSKEAIDRYGKEILDPAWKKEKANIRKHLH